MNPIMSMLCKNKPYSRLNLVNHVRDDPFSSYGRLPEKLIFCSLDTNSYMCISGCKKYQFTRNLLYILIRRSEGLECYKPHQYL